MNHPRILVQLDTDSHCSSFDAVVALDSQVDHLLQYASVNPDNVVGLIHGTMFTRGPDQLKNTAIFVGGSSVAAGEALLDKIRSTFFGPVRVSVMLDPNGANTTAAAAVLAAAKHLDLANSKVLVLGGTGPVGQRVARLVLGQGGHVALASRSLTRAVECCFSMAMKVDAEQRLVPLGLDSVDSIQQALGNADAVVACGAAGVTLLDEPTLQAATNLKVAIDLNAVPPSGIAGIGVMDKAVVRSGRIDYGAIGVGGLKMKIHRAAIASLFHSNDTVLDAEEIFQVGLSLS